MPRISQREAKRLRKRLSELERAIETQRRTYGQEWFRGVNIATINCDAETYAAVRTAILLRHGVVIQTNAQHQLVLMALPQPKAEA